MERAEHRRPRAKLRAANQGFIDLHTPLGFFLIGTAFLVFSLLIMIGAIYAREIAAREKESRRKLAEEQRAKSQRPTDQNR